MNDEMELNHRDTAQRGAPDRGSVTRSNLVRQPVLELFPADLVYHIAAGRRPALRHLSIASSLFQRIPAYSNVFFRDARWPAMESSGMDQERMWNKVELCGWKAKKIPAIPGISGIFRDIPGYSGIFRDK